MPRTKTAASRRHARVVSLNDRLRACRRCHLAGYLDERDSVPIARDPDPDSPVPRILLVGQAPGLRATIQDRPFAGIAGDKLRAWFEKGGIPRDEFYARIHFAAVTRCYPGRIPGARGDRLPSPEEQALCRPWLDELIESSSPRSSCSSARWRSARSSAHSNRSRTSSARPRSATASATSPCPIRPESADGSTSRPTSRPSIGR